MHLTYSQEKITALMGTKEPFGRDETVVAMHVIDGILENGESYGYSDWFAELALQTYADEHFLEREEIESNDLDWDEVREAVAEALRVLQLPKGIVLVNADSHAVFACGDDLDDAKDHLAKELGAHLAFTDVGHTGFRTAAADGRYIVVAAPVPKCGWEADDADYVLTVGNVEGYLLTHEMAEAA